MEIDISKFPPLLQAAAFIGVMVAGAVAWILAKRKPATVDTERLQQQLDQAQLKADLARVLDANREAFFKSMSDLEKRTALIVGELEDRVRTLEIEHASFRERLGYRRTPR